MKLTLIFLLGLVTGVGCAATVGSGKIARHTAAFNAHDVEALGASVSDDFVWYNVAEGDISIEAAGRSALTDGLAQYFGELPTVRARIANGFELGPYAAVAERVTWQGRDGERSQAAVAVYRFDDGLISRVWYFPSTP